MPCFNAGRFYLLGGELIELREKLLASDLSNPNNLELLFAFARNESDRPLVRRVRRLSAKYAKAEEDDGKKQHFLRLYRESLLYMAPYDFDSYMIYVELEREPEKRFYEPRREKIKPIVDALQDLEDDYLDVLSISMPPGTGKSTLGIFFMSWIAGKYPDSPNLMSGFSGTLTKGFYEGVLQIITDDEYLWHDVFPNVQLVDKNSKEETIDLGKRKRFKTITCRAINATLTGATRCEKYLYADDLCSGIEEAMSKERLDKLWNAYKNDLKSRKKQGCKEIHIATRWSVHDVIGRLSVMYENNPRARFIVVPALDENGESNFDYKCGVGFDKAYFEDMRSTLDDIEFRALYQNEPIEREGLLYPDDELRRFFELPKGDPDAIIAVCDTKDRGKDYAVLPVVYVFGSDYYIEDVICDASEAYEGRAVELLARHRVQMARFESNSAGGRIARDIQAELKKRGAPTAITTKYTTSNKETKIIVNAPYVKEHFLFKDESKYVKNSDYGRMIRFLTSYTVTGKNKFDDVPDAMAMLALFAQALTGNKATVLPRIF